MGMGRKMISKEGEVLGDRARERTGKRLWGRRRERGGVSVDG